MSRYFLRRVLQIIPSVFGVVVMAFTLVSLAPGDAAVYLAGGDAPAEVIEKIRAQYGLDQMAHVQFGKYLVSVLHGDLGFSFRFQEPVTRIILASMPLSLLLIGAAVGFGTFVGIPLGIVAARWKHTALDYLLSSVAVCGYSVPVFWLGQILVILFALTLGWLPSQGASSLYGSASAFENAVDVAKHLILPMITLAAWHMAVVVRVTRSALLEVLHEDYIRTARAKGLSEFRITLVHAFRNAVIPCVTIVGVNVGVLMSGAVLTETVFAWPGLGRLFVSAILARDYPLLMGLFIATSLAVMILTLVTDLVYAKADPRIRYR